MTAFEPGSTYCIDGTTLKVWDGEDWQVSAELVQYSTGYKDPVQNAINCMRSAGFKFKEPPPSELTLSNPEGGMPELPDDPTILPEDDLMRLCFAFTEWTSYAESSLWVAQCDEGDLETKLSRARGKALAAVTGEKTVTAAKSAASADPDVVRLEDSLYRQTCLRRGMEMILIRCTRNAAAMSRELSRRGSKVFSGRADKWGN